MVRESVDYIEACPSFHPHPALPGVARRCFSSLRGQFPVYSGQLLGHDGADNGEMRARIDELV